MKQENISQESFPRESLSLKTAFGHECTGVHISSPIKPETPLVYAIGRGTDTNMHTPIMQVLAEKGYGV